MIAPLNIFPYRRNASENVEEKRFGDPIVPKYEIPYNADILESINGLDKDAAGRVAGNRAVQKLCAAGLHIGAAAAVRRVVDNRASARDIARTVETQPASNASIAAIILFIR